MRLNRMVPAAEAWRAALASLCIVLGTACSGGRDSGSTARKDVGGVIVIAASADPDILLPSLTMSAQGKQIVDQVFDNLADIGPSLNTIGDTDFKPRLARSWQWGPDSAWIEFTLDPRARWHDGQPVTSDDVRFTFMLVKDEKFGSPQAPNLSEVDSVSTDGPQAARIWLASHPPNLFYRLAGTIAILPAHLLMGAAADTIRSSEFGRHPVGSGRFKFSAWKQGESVTLVSDSSNYRGRARADRVVWLISPDYNSAALRFLAGNADFLDVVKPEFVDRVRQATQLQFDASVPSLNYGYVSFNLVEPKARTPHRIFSSRNVRRALAMAVDRERLVRNVLDTLGSVARGPFARGLATSDAGTSPSYDTTEAASILDSEGWKRSTSGIRNRNGRPLSFRLLVPSSSAIRMKFATLLQEQWHLAGADVVVEPIEMSAFGSHLEAHDFDAMINAWQIDPDPGSVRDEWMSSAKREGGNNFTSYSNPLFDAVIDSAAREPSRDRAVALYRRAYSILTDDTPAMWLYEPRNVFGVSKLIHPVGMRADAWWADLADWGGR